MIVLSVVAVFSLCIMLVQKDVTARVQARLFLSHIQRQLVTAQTYAMTSGEETQVWFDTTHAHSSVPKSASANVPDNIRVTPYRYVFSGGSGQLKTYQQLVVTTEDRLYKMRVQFGKGVFWVEEVSQ